MAEQELFPTETSFKGVKSASKKRPLAPPVPPTESVELIQRALMYAKELPSSISLGTSTWTYEGWSGLVYHDAYPSKAAFTKGSLTEYGRCPLFRAVGVDSTYYKPGSVEVYDGLAHAAPQIRFVLKAWQEISSHRYEEHFLDFEVFKDACLTPLIDSVIMNQNPQLLLQFSNLPRHLISSGQFLERLRLMLRKARAFSPAIQIGVEVRNAELLTAQYLSVLNDTLTDHVFSWSTEMPDLIVQLKAIARAGGIQGPRYIVRALIPPGFDYEETKILYEPFNQIRLPSESLHADLMRIIKRAGELNREVIILYGNKAEGCSPLSLARTVVNYFG